MSLIDFLKFEIKSWILQGDGPIPCLIPVLKNRIGVKSAIQNKIQNLFGKTKCKASSWRIFFKPDLCCSEILLAKIHILPCRLYSIDFIYCVSNLFKTINQNCILFFCKHFVKRYLPKKKKIVLGIIRLNNTKYVMNVSQRTPNGNCNWLQNTK